MDNKRIKNGLTAKRVKLVASIEKVKASIQPKIDALHEAIKAKTDSLETELKFTDIMLKQIDDFEAIKGGKEPATEVQETPAFLGKGKKS
jgi:hypothetical protein